MLCADPEALTVPAEDVVDTLSGCFSADDAWWALLPTPRVMPATEDEVVGVDDGPSEKAWPDGPSGSTVVSVARSMSAVGERRHARGN